MPNSIFQEISSLINKRKDLSPSEKTSLSMVIHHFEENYTDQKKVNKILTDNESHMPGIKKDIIKKNEEDIQSFKKQLIKGINSFGVEHPELMDNISRLCTSLSNLGI